MTEDEKKAKAAKKPAAKKDASPKKDEVKKEVAKKPAAKKESAPAAEKKAPAVKKEKKAAEGVKKTGKLIDDIRLYDVISSPRITEKTTIAAEQNKVVFNINPTASKQEVKAAVEALFGVKVEKVNTIKTKGKVKRFRGRTGQRSDHRKAIVTLKEGQSIDLAAGLK